MKKYLAAILAAIVLAAVGGFVLGYVSKSMAAPVAKTVPAEVTYSGFVIFGKPDPAVIWI